MRLIFYKNLIFLTWGTVDVLDCFMVHRGFNFHLPRVQKSKIVLITRPQRTRSQSQKTSCCEVCSLSIKDCQAQHLHNSALLQCWERVERIGSIIPALTHKLTILDTSGL
jgi:hypothetical protein